MLSYKVQLTPAPGFVHGDGLSDAARALAVQDAKAQLSLLDRDSIRAKIYALQAVVGEMAPVDCPLQHTFAPDVYLRTIVIPKGSVIVGKIHKHAHGNILSKGSVAVLTEAGGIERLEGPLTMVSEPGTKRALYALTELVWTTIHPNPTNTHDLEVIEDFTIAKSFEEYEAQTQQIEVT